MTEPVNQDGGPVINNGQPPVTAVNTTPPSGGVASHPPLLHVSSGLCRARQGFSGGGLNAGGIPESNGPLD